MKFTDKAILGGAFLTGIIGVLAYKGKLKWPDPRKPAAGSGAAPVHPSQSGTGTPAYHAQAAAPAAPAPEAPATPAADPSQYYEVGGGDAGRTGGDAFTADVGD